MTLPYFQKFSKSCCPCPLDWLRGESAAADRYKNFCSALQLLEEEMAWECGDGQPFIDPGFQAYEAFDYKKPQDNGPGWSWARCPHSSCCPHSWGQAAQGGGTRGGEQGEA